MFQDEPDEPSSPELFQNERSEDDGSVFRDEPDEKEALTRPTCSSFALQDEPDELSDEPCGSGPFKAELDERPTLFNMFWAGNSFVCFDDTKGNSVSVFPGSGQMRVPMTQLTSQIVMKMRNVLRREWLNFAIPC